MADELEYLSPDFDLNSLTVPRLRSILVNHDVPYPASAKKTQLIRILQDEVLPQARKLLRERERVKRTSDGITDMGNRGSSALPRDVDGSQPGTDRESVPPPPTPSTASTITGTRRGRPKRSTRASTADTDDANTPATTSRTVADDATPRRPIARKLRGSEEPSLPEHEPSDQTPSAVDNVFTDDNPFQSGSPSPPLEQERSAKGRSRARKSETPSRHKRESAVAAEKPSYSTSLPSPKEESDEGEEAAEVSAGEEFTPEEQLAMEREQADMLYSRDGQRNRQARKQGGVSNMLAWLFIVSLFGTFGAWWRREKIEIGFCGIGKPTWSLADTRIPQWANILEPHCEICPAHAFCYPNLEVRCEHDFILKPHPLSLGGLIPLPPTCEADSEKARRVKAVADKAVEKLRDRKAKWECGELRDGGKEAKSAEISEPALKQEVGRKRRKGMSDAEFDDLWKGALGEIIGKEEIVSKTKQPSGVLTLSSTSITRLPFACALRRYVRLALLAYRLPLSILISFGCVLAYVRSRVLAHRSDMARVPELVTTTLDRLATQASLHARGESRIPYIPIGQLRDDVLRSELRGNRREELWRRVRSVVEGNANVRAAVREGHGGDVSRVWEWVGGIGSVAEVEGSARRRESYRAPFSPERSRHPTDMENDTPFATGLRDSRHWDEGRPIY